MKAEVILFDGRYLDWNQKRIKGILEFYGHKFMYYKKILDLGCGHADISGVFHRLGADITAVDARQDHLKIAQKKYPGIKVLKADLDRGWPFRGQQFDLILDMDLICHLKDYESHLRNVCASCTHLILETAVHDHDDPFKSVPLPENKAVYDLSVNGMGNLPTTNSIERILAEAGMNFRRQDVDRYNSSPYIYDWKPSNDGKSDVNRRRLWFALKQNSPIQFARTTSSELTNIAPVTNSPIRPSGMIIPPPPPQIQPVVPSVIGSKNFVIVIPSYKNAQWCEKNILSTLTQNYENYRVIFTDDNSPDNTFEKVEKVVRNHQKSDKISLHKNSVRVGALENLYNMITSCNDNEIILTLDGDDWLANDNVLSKLDTIYSDEQVWMTYGQYKNYPDGGMGVSKPIPHNIITGNSYRQYTWCSSHLRTFYAWLFKKIKVDDLKYNGKFMSSAWDATIMYPQLEMSYMHSRFIQDVLYIYNLENPINDHKVDVNLQQWFDHYVRTMPKYSKIEKPAMEKKKIGLMFIATGKYDRFLQGIISSADNFFLPGNYDITYYIFGDKQTEIKTSRKVVNIPIEHKPFPHASMDRFKHFTNNAQTLSSEDYLYYVDVDCLFVDNVGQEILGNLVGVRHCGYLNRVGTYETNSNSVFYVDAAYPKQYKYYFGGGFSGGKSGEYLKLAQWCNDKIDQDLVNGVMPLWHDETAINRYFLDNEPDVILSPSYHYPQSNIATYKAGWAPLTFNPKILLLDKNHEEVRK